MPPSLAADGKRHRRTFATADEAKRYAAQLRQVYANGNRGNLIPASLALEAAQAQRLLDGTGLSLLDAAKEAARRHRNAADQETFRERWLATMTAGESRWSARYLTDMSRVPRWLPDDFLALRVADIDEVRIREALLARGELAQTTLRLRVRMVAAALTVRESRGNTRPPEVLSGEQVSALIAAATDPAERRTVALLLFAGIRPDAAHGEISRLRWEDIGQSAVLVRPEASKTGTDRLVPLTPRLRRELKGRPAAGPVAPGQWVRRWARIRKNAGITGQDLTRHTFASHFLAWKGEDAALAAMGHAAGSRTLFRHYRRAVSADAGKAYFA